jgi:hypothetical protein
MAKKSATATTAKEARAANQGSKSGQEKGSEGSRAE